MIVVRDVFELSKESLRAAESAFRELGSAGVQAGLGPARVMRDRTNAFFARADGESRLVIEREFPTIESFTQRTSFANENEDWQAAWTACKPFVRRAWREVLDTVE